MASPSVDLDGIMPYGVTVSGDGTNRTAKFVTSAKQAKENRLELPGGPVRVSASWSGAEAVRLTLAGVGYPVNIPAGGIPVWDGGRWVEKRGRYLPGISQRRATFCYGARHHRGVPTPTALTAQAVV